MGKQEDVLESLKVIIDPDLGRDIVTLGFVKDLAIDDAGAVSFKIELTTPACPIKEQFRRSAQEAVSALPWVSGVEVTMGAQPRRPVAGQQRAPGLRGVANLVAVSSCKGGVGKSTVAVNLAYALAATGAEVGIFDADVYGPSLPTLVNPDEANVFAVGEMIQPLHHRDVKLMSFGFVNSGPKGGPAIMRGPMVSQVINQLLTTTEWGELDYLIIDMPPGTGDIQLTLLQLIPLTAAVIVTTPQQLSFVDVVKGIEMFDKLKVPTIAVVENMSYFVCASCDARHAIFGTGAKRKLVEQFGIQNAFEIPMDPVISRMSDAGTPVVLDAPAIEPAKLYGEIAGAVAREVSKLKHGAIQPPKVAFRTGEGIVVKLASGDEHLIPAAEVRRRCRCALCIEEMTGKPILDPGSVSEDVYPKQIQSVGNYAVAIHWSDGHTTSIYPYDVLLADYKSPARAA